MAGNTEFYEKAEGLRITWKDIFSDVFKRHNRSDGERLFVAGTALSTPDEGQMLSQWKKPWLFARVGFAGIAFILIMLTLMENGGLVFAFVPLLFVGAVVTPLSVLLLMWEMNIPRNVPIYSVLGMFMVGGGLSLIFTLIMNNIIGDVPAYLAPLTEEPAKLLALCIFLRNCKYKYTLNGILIGAAIGAGFASIETMGYALQNDFGTLLMRGILAPGGHVVWAALYGGALAQAKGTSKLSSAHFKDKQFIEFFAMAFALHFLWNSDFSLVPLPVVVDLKFVLLIIIAWVALLNMIKKGIAQTMRLSKPVPDASPCASTLNDGNARLKCISGIYNGNVFPVTGQRLVMGRDNSKANIIFPGSTPGISSVHCELTFENGVITLTDKNSSYGTFLSDGTRLVPGKPYRLNTQSGFYLASRDNSFEIE